MLCLLDWAESISFALRIIASYGHPNASSQSHSANRKEATGRQPLDKTVRVYVIFRDCRVPRVKLDGARTTRTTSECRSSRDKLPLKPLRDGFSNRIAAACTLIIALPTPPVDLSWATSRLLPGSDECMYDQDKASVRRVFPFFLGEWPMDTHPKHPASQKRRSVCR